MEPRPEEPGREKYRHVLTTIEFYSKWHPELKWEDLSPEIQHVLHVGRLEGASAALALLIQYNSSQDAGV